MPLIDSFRDVTNTRLEVGSTAPRLSSQREVFRSFACECRAEALRKRNGRIVEPEPRTRLIATDDAALSVIEAAFADLVWGVSAESITRSVAFRRFESRGGIQLAVAIAYEQTSGSGHL